MRKLIQNVEGRKVLKLVTLKGIKTGFGHDTAGVIAKVYIGKEFIGEYYDDGRGGESSFRKTTEESYKLFIDLLTKHNFKQLMFDTGWDFMGSVDKITDQSMIEEIVARNIILIDIENNIKAKSKKKLLFGKPFDISYKEIGWEGSWTLEKIVTKDKSLLENLIEEIVKDLGSDEKIINNNLKDFNLSLSEFAKSKLLY